MNVTEQSFTLSCYTSGEILSARQKADNRRPSGDVSGKQSFPKRGTKCREEKRDKGRNIWGAITAKIIVLLLLGTSLLLLGTMFYY